MGERKFLLLLLLAAVCACGGRTPDTWVIDASAPDGRGDVPSWPVSGQRNARYLRSEGSYLYWLVDESNVSVLKRCEKRDCGGTQTAAARFALTGHLMGFEIRGDTLYLVSQRAILRCALDDCRELATIIVASDVASSAIEAVAFDDTSVFWSMRLQGKIFSCPLEGCKAPSSKTGGSTPVLELAVGPTHLYWIAGDAPYSDRSIAVFSAPKDGSAGPKALATRQNQAASLVVREGFVYWSTSYTLGGLARCPLAGCAGDEPEMLTERQYFPQFLNPEGDSLFWMNGPGGPDMASSLDRPVQLMECRLPNCASSATVLEEGHGGGFGVHANQLKTFDTEALPAREMVVDSDALYWIGDIVNAVPSAPVGSQLDGVIRRTLRTR